VEVDHERTKVKMYKKAQTPLYEGCPNSRLASILLLLNLVTTHGVSNTFVDELFTILWVDLFPKDNTPPKSLYQAKNIVQWLRLTYNSIHVYYNGCLLFKGELNEARACPKCQRSRFVERSNNVPYKVL
jgi:hypothetical protein